MKVGITARVRSDRRASQRSKARGLVTDVRYGAVLSPAVELRDGDYADLQGASLVMITAGANEKTGGATDRNDPAGRLRLLDTNVDVYKDIVPRLHAAAPQTLTRMRSLISLKRSLPAAPASIQTPWSKPGTNAAWRALSGN
jgi:hypothetical protein